MTQDQEAIARAILTGGLSAEEVEQDYGISHEEVEVVVEEIEANPGWGASTFADAAPIRHA